MIYIYKGCKHAKVFDVIRTSFPTHGEHPAGSADGCAPFCKEFKNIVKTLGLNQDQNDGYIKYVFPGVYNDHYISNEAGWMSINEKLTDQLINILDSVGIEYILIDVNEEE